MDGKIGLEEHFSFEDTIEDSNGFLDPSVWPELKSRLLDFSDKRLKFILSLERNSHFKVHMNNFNISIINYLNSFKKDLKNISHISIKKLD